MNRPWRVAWERDLPAGVPVKITLFDEDYVVVRGRERDPKRHVGGLLPSDEEPVAMLDKCPHRLAALSEGRAVFTARTDTRGVHSLTSKLNLSRV